MAEIRQRLPEKAGRRTSSKYSKNKINIADKRSYTFYTVFLLSLLSGICFYFNWIGNFTATYDNSLALSELPKALVDDIYNKTGWGTMRPQLYFGLKTKHPNSPLFGLLWYKQPQEQLISSLPIRHWCEHGDDVKFSYEAHDGKTFGRQQIVDRELQLQTSWIAVGQRSWSARLTGKVEENEDSGKSSYALVFYLATRGHTSGLIPHNQMIDDSVYAFLAGASQQLGQFTLEFRIKPSAAAISHVAYTIPPQMDMRHVNELVLASLARGQSEEELKLHQNPQIPGPQAGEGGANFAAVQFMVSGNFDLKLHFLAAEDEPLDNFEAAFAHKMTDFDQKFVDAFPIDSTFGQHRELAKRAVASLLGGIGVWHGHALVRTGEHEEPQPYGPLSLLSAVPSRPFFPRGFLWDEGFHNLLIRRFDPELSLQIFASWMDTMNVDGWIPREMILGEEAQAKVPAEFLVQRPSIANPPMFFYVLDKFVRNTELLKRHHHQIARIYPRLKQLYIWLRQTQRGPRPGTMQWQGRNRTTDRELNPKILPSGLDDFPRATHPSPEEYHLDLRCWMALSSRVLRHLAETFGDSDWVPVVEEDMRAFNDVAQLDDLHWSEEQQRYADFGLHSSRVKLVQVTLKKEAKRAAHGEGQQQERQFVRKVLEGPRLRLVDDVFGYVNLFPILLRLLPNDSPKLGILLRSLNRTEDLWTSYGLRSLSTKSPYYLVKNTEHDPPYWRGPVWINMNYLALDALRHYASSGGGPNARLATQLYEQLRGNVVRNIAEQYAKTGFFWEHYNDRTGEGMGTRPFTGWTALVANILAEAYD